MHAWSQVLSLGLSVVELSVALWPRAYDASLSGGLDPFRLTMWPKLVRFPVFWIGLALLGYVVLQACNPAWIYAQTPGYFWLVRRPGVPWLPAGVSAPSDRFNVWRAVIIYGSVWLTGCAIWVGLTRRVSIRAILGVLSANACVIGAVVIVQHLGAGPRTAWPLAFLTDKSLTGTFIYENHAGAYLALAAVPAMALACWFSDHGRRTMMKSTPAGVLVMAAMFLAVCVPLTLSRGASVSLGVGMLIFVGWFLLRRWLRPMPAATNPRVTAVVALVFAVVALNTFRHLDFTEVYTRFDQMASQGVNEGSVHSRLLARAAAEDMLSANWVRGVGAGCFRHLFPGYARNYPEIYDHGNLFWEHAHCDWLEIPIELGLVGDLLLLAAFVWWSFWFVRYRTWWSSLSAPLLLGCLQTGVHAAFDFPLQCPAILVTWASMVALAGKWTELEGRGDGERI